MGAKQLLSLADNQSQIPGALISQRTEWTVPLCLCLKTNPSMLFSALHSHPYLTQIGESDEDNLQTKLDTVACIFHSQTPMARWEVKTRVTRRWQVG